MKKENLVEHLNFEVQMVSDDIFEQFQKQMAHFGIDLNLSATKKNPEKMPRYILKVNTLPKIIAKKLNSDPNTKLLVHNLLIKQLEVFSNIF